MKKSIEAFLDDYRALSKKHNLRFMSPISITRGNSDNVPNSWFRISMSLLEETEQQPPPAKYYGTWARTAYVLLPFCTDEEISLEFGKPVELIASMRARYKK